jgi:hypothetical protein
VNGPRPDPVLDVLDQEELNLGQSMSIDSQNFVPTYTDAAGATVPFHASNAVGPGELKRILEFAGASKKSKMITLALNGFSELIAGDLVLAGPIVAEVEFGSGSAISRIELNVPVNYQTKTTSNNPITQNGVILSLPGSSFRVRVRNDAADYPRDLSGNAVPGSSQIGLGSASRIKVSCHASYNSRPGHDSSGGAVRRFLPLVIAGQLNGNNTVFTIPPFSRSVKFVRNKFTTNNLSVTFGYTETDGGPGPFTIPSGIESPQFSIPTGAGYFRLTSTELSDTIYADFSVQG